MAVPEPKTLGRYTIERLIGRGSMGVVYEGLDPRLNRRVAIKTILKAQLDDEAARDYSARFVREAHAVARLNHPHIVQVYDFGEEGDVAYLVMEYIRGRELKKVFDANERPDLRESVRIMRELLGALDFAHQAGIVHRDVKPGNVMLDAEGRAKLTDFGVARLLDKDRTHGTQGVVGTPAYMSPEQISGAAIDSRTDLFSAGIVLYQFLTGELPFSGAGAWTIAKKIMQDEPAAPSTLNTSLPPVLDAVVKKALAKSPDARYQSAREFSAALQQALESLQGPSQDAEVEFWRSIKDSSDPADFELYLEQFPKGIYSGLARRKLERYGRPSAASDETVRMPLPGAQPERRSARVGLIAAGIAVLALAAGALWVTTRQAQSDKEAQAAAAKAAERAADERLKLERAAIDKAVAEKLAAERAAMEKALADKFAAEKLALEKAAAERAAREQSAAATAAADKAKAERVAAEKAAADRAAAERMALERAAQAKLAADRAAAERAAERVAAEKAAAEKAAAEKAAAEKTTAERIAAEKAAKAAADLPRPSTSRFPSQGDSWTYRLTQRDNRDAPQQRYTVTILSASDTRIAERYALESGKTGQLRHEKGPYLFAAGPVILSPYFAVFEDLAPGTPLRNISVREDVCPPNYLCLADGRVGNRETVRVAAGTFETVRVTVDHEWRPASGSTTHQSSAGQMHGGRTMTLWYAPSVKRVVKASSKLNAGDYPPVDANFELELVSYKLN